jgi:prevent-host-death family protein
MMTGVIGIRRCPVAKRVSVTDARARFSALIDEVERGSERVIIERRGRPVAMLVRVEEYEQGDRPPPSGHRPVGALALVGAWSDVDDSDIDAFVEDLYAARRAGISWSEP